MKENLSRMWRSGVALLLVFSMVFGFIPVTAFAATDSSTEEQKEKLVYVSIGDSMTNGYGIDGYDGESGIMNYGINTYANQFAAYLAGYTGPIADDQTVFVADDGSKTVDHRQLAMSGMRSEDLAWLLQLDYVNMTDAEAKWIEKIRSAPNDANAPWQVDLDDNYCVSCGTNHIHGFQHEWGNGREYWYSYDVRTDTPETVGMGFASGDWRTFTDLLNPSYRLADGAAKVLSMYGKDGFTFESNSVTVNSDNVALAQQKLATNQNYPDSGQWSSSDIDALFGGVEGRWLRFIAEFYQESVADANVITLALGNTNFGTFMFDTIKELFLSSDTCAFASRYNIEEVYLMAERAGVDDALMAMIKDLIKSELEPMMEEQFAAIANEVVPDVVGSFTVDPYSLLERNEDGNITKGALIKYIIEYCVLSYIVGYIATLDRIVTLNPDVEIIQIALMNSYKTEDSEPGSFADIIDMLYGPMNAFIAMMPDYLAQRSTTDEHYVDYSKAKFYYADCGIVETLSAVYGDDFYTYDNESITYDEYLELIVSEAFDKDLLVHNTSSTVRSRFHKWIAGADGCKHDCSGGDQLKDYGAHAYISDCYLCMEIYHGPTDSSYGWGKFEYAELLKYIVGPMECPYPDDTIMPTAEDKTNYNNGWNFNKFFNKYRMVMVSQADIREYEKMTADEKNAMLLSEETFTTYTTQKGTKVPYSFRGNSDKGFSAGTTAAVRKADWAFSCAMYLALEEATILAGNQGFTLSALTSVQGMTPATFKGVAAQFATEMDQPVFGEGSELTDPDADAIRVNFRNALLNDGPTVTMLCLANRMQIGSGIGGHPSEGGHDDMFAAIKRDYEANNNGDAVVEAFAMSYLESKYPKVYGMLMGGDSIADKDDLAIIIQMLKMSDSAALAGVDLDALEAEIRATLKAYKNAHTEDEQKKAQAAADTLYLKLVALATAATGTEYEANENSFYVSLGDSNVTGYGLDGYVENDKHGVLQLVEGSAPVQLAMELYGENWKDRFGQYAQGALRSEDMLYILCEDEDQAKEFGIVPDDYYYAEIEGNLLNDNIADTRAEYIEVIKNADLISINIGGGNITTFTGEQMDRVIAGEKLVEMDWTKIGYNDETIAELNAFLDEMVPLMDMMGMMDKYLPEDVTLGENCGAAEFGSTLLESLLYGYASYNYYYPMVLERIREINPDAQLLILGMFNPVDDWTTTVDGKILDIGGITNNLMESANLQNLAYALQNGNTSFIDLSETETFLDAEYADKAEGPTFDVYYKSILEGDGKEVHASADGHAYMFEQMLAALSGRNTEDEVKDVVAVLYAGLTDTYMTTEEKLDFLAELYATLKAEGKLGENREIVTLEKVYEFLDSNEYIDDEQTLAIVIDFCEYLLAEEQNQEAELALIDKIYTELLGNTKLDAEAKLDVIAGTYNILKNAGYLGAYAGYLALLEEIVALPSLQKISDEKTFALVDFIFQRIKDGETSVKDVREIIGYIYNVVLKTKNSVARIMTTAAGEDLTVEEKLEIIKDIFGVMAENEELKAAYPQVEAVVELYDELTVADANGEKIIPDSVMIKLFDQVMETVGDTTVDLNDTAVINSITTDIANTILTSPEIKPENKVIILEKVAETLGEVSGMGGIIGGGEGDSAIPGMDVIDDLRAELSASGYLTAKQEGEIVEAVADVLFKYLNGEELSDEEMILVGEEVYNIVFNREDLSIQDKFAILTIIYNVLDKHDYVNNAYEMGYETVKGMGYVAEASKYIGIAIDAVETAKKAVSEFPVNEELATIKEALLAELEATTQTLTKIKGLLDSDALATKDGAWTELLNLRGELDNHIAKLQTLAAQIGFVAAPYIADAIEAYNYYSELIQKIAVEAYNNVVNAFETFADQYAILVEEIGKIADKCHPALGVAVRKYLTETPADALAILYAHGENAINVLLAKAALASGDIYNIAVALGQAFAENGEAIYNAVAESAEVDEILKLIDETKDELLALYEKAVKHPVTTAMKVDVRAAQTKILNLYNALFAEISQIATNVSGMEETAALVEALRTALIDLIDVADYAGQYGDWIAGDMMIMVDELLASLIANNDEFMQVFMPLFCENISFVNDYLTDLVKEYGGKAWAIYLEIRDVVIPEIINTIREFGEQAKEQILKQLNTVRDMVKNTVETVKEIIDELKLKLDELKTKVQNEAKAVVEKVEALLDYLKELLAKSGLSEDILKDIYDAIKQVEKALDALKEIINGNFESIYEMLDALAAAKAELLEALNNLADILKNDAKAVYDQIIKQLNTVNDAVNCLIDNRDEIVKELGLWLLAELVEALPTIDQKLYDFFYNNPDKVIAFFENYGDLIIENGEPVVAVLGYIAVTYGPEVLEWIIENPEEALELFVNWYEKYGYRVWPMIDVYLDALGVYDAAEEGFQAALEKLADLMDMAGEEITAELKAMIEDLQTALENLVAEVESVIAELTAKLEALEKELADLKAQLENAVGELKEQLEAAIAELEKKIAEIKAAIENLKAALKAIQEALLELNEAIETLLNEGFNAAIEAVQGALKNMTEAVEDLLGAISEETAAELKKAIESVLAKLNELYYNATHGEYTIYPFSHYVALGDGTAAGKSYVEMLAAELAAIREGDYDFTNLSEDGLMIQDVLEILAENAETVAGADLVTIGFGSNGFTNFTVEQLMKLINGETVEFDWAQYVGEDGVTYVETAKAELYARLVANGVTGVVDNVDVTELLMVAIESYAYGYVSYVCSLPEVVNEVHALNPEALVVVVGMYNPLADVVIDLEGQKLELGGYLQYLVDAANVDALAYAMLTGDVVYVDAPAVETNNKSTEMTLAAFMSEFLYYKAANLLPNENGHGYITEQILNALTITVKGLWGDVNGDGVVNHNDARLVLQYYVGAVTADDLDLTVADVDGNGVINHNDARLILQFYVEMIDIFPVEK